MKLFKNLWKSCYLSYIIFFFLKIWWGLTKLESKKKGFFFFGWKWWIFLNKNMAIVYNLMLVKTVVSCSSYFCHFLSCSFAPKIFQPDSRPSMSKRKVSWLTSVPFSHDHDHSSPKKISQERKKKKVTQ